MRELKLYTSKLNLKLSIATGVVTAALGLYLPTLGDVPMGQPDPMWVWVGLAANVGGAWLVIRAVMGLMKPKPVFHGTADGFSVHGKRMRPWTEYRGVSLHAMSHAFIGLGKFVRVKVGKSMLGGYVQINPLQLSGKAIDMVAEIRTFAAHAQRKDDLIEALSAIPAEPLAGRVDASVGRRRADPMPTAAFAPSMSVEQTLDTELRSPKAGGAMRQGLGPVESVPKMSERLFGRRKVI